MRNWLAGKVLRRRRVNPGCPFAKALASWAARTIGAKGRERWNQERRWRKAVKWANADEARRTFEHALWMFRQAEDKRLDAILVADGPTAMMDALIDSMVSMIDPRGFALMVDYHRNVAPQFITVEH